mgnify:CR=1 FL=1
MEFTSDYKAVGEQVKPIHITQNECTRRMKEMSAMQTGFGFYGEMPDNDSLVLNTDHPLVAQVLNDVEGKDNEVIDKYAAENPVVRQLIDLALLSNGMLKGEALNNFINRSISLI